MQSMTESQSNRFDFEFEPRLADLIDLINEVFAGLRQAPLLDNPAIEFDDRHCFPHHMVFDIHSANKNTVDLTVYLTVDSIRVDIDRINETLEWGLDDVKNSREKVREFLQTVLSGYIFIDTRGASRFIQIFDADGFLFHSMSINNFLHFFTRLYLLREKGFQRLFMPIFEK